MTTVAELKAYLDTLPQDLEVLVAHTERDDCGDVDPDEPEETKWYELRTETQEFGKEDSDPAVLLYTSKLAMG
ncbi:MAG: hypothetical protein KJ587_19890 [Alphaproteobacteria bacterium]|nr:hypothetical protein [Alphaproteobacteria bacterium]